MTKITIYNALKQHDKKNKSAYVINRLKSLLTQLAGYTLILFFMLINITYAYAANITHPAATINNFTINHQAINPACLALINGSEADLPYIYQINLNRCQNANATYVKEKNKTSFTKANGFTYSYQVIGETLNHIFVVASYIRSNGTGIFQNILLLRLKHDSVIQWNSQSNTLQPQQYLALQYLGNLGGGDRYTGSFLDLHIVGNQLLGERYSIKNPSALEKYPRSKVSINLKNIK